MKPITYMNKGLRLFFSALFITFFICSLMINVIMFSWSAGALAISTAFSAVTGISSVISDLAGASKTLRTKNQQLNTKSNRLETSNTKLKAENNQLNAKNKTLETSNTKLKTENDQFSMKNKTLEASNTKLKTENDQFSMKNKTLEASNAKLQDANGQLSAKNKTLEARFNTNKNKISTISNRVAKRTGNMVARSVIYVPQKSLPKAGIFVILALTAWELSDACATMKDIKELNRLLESDLSAVEEGEKEVCGHTLPTAQDVWISVKSSPQAIYEGVKGVELPSWDEVKGGTQLFWDRTVEWSSKIGNRFLN